MRQILLAVSLFLAAASSFTQASPARPSVPSGIVFEGDSITAGVGQNTLSYPAQFGALTGIPFTNNGLPGDKLIRMRSGYRQDAAPLFNAATRDTLVINGGTNDIGGDGTSAAVLEGYVRDMAAAARATGYKVFVSTITPRGFGPAQEAIRAAFNRAMRDQWRDFADGMIDFDAAVPYDGAHFYDGLHPSNQGAALMAHKVGSALGIALAAVPSKGRP